MKAQYCGAWRRLVGFAVLFGMVAIANGQTWQNETNNAAEADYAVLQTPTSFIVTNGLDASPSIYGRIFESGVTNLGSPGASILAQVGWGGLGTDPRSVSWTWTAATFNTHIGNDDEYVATFTTPATAGTYSFTYRFSTDSGTSWTLGDTNGTGSNAGLTLEIANFGSFTVQNTAIPEPAQTSILAAVFMLGLATWHRKRCCRTNVA